MNFFDVLDDLGLFSKKGARRLMLAVVVVALFVPKVWGWTLDQATQRAQSEAAPILAAYMKALPRMERVTAPPTHH